MSSTILIEQHIDLAEWCALDYLNIPGCNLDDTRSEAHLALIRAANAYRPEKGEFQPFATRVIRNALNSLYAKQLRMLRVFPKSLDERVCWSSGISADISEPAGQNLHSVARNDTFKQVRDGETNGILESVMKFLTPREQLVVSEYRDGSSYAEIGQRLGITKQAAHKSARSGLIKLKENLARLGYHGMASDGQIGSAQENKFRKEG